MKDLGGTSTNDPDEFYRQLQLKLDDQHSFPTLYMFKFIVPNDPDKVEQLNVLFKEANLSKRHSKSGKYVSVTAKEVMVDSATVISRYRIAAEIEGIVSL
jgi:hypothetical protein